MSHVLEDQQVNKVAKLSGTDKTKRNNKGPNSKFTFTVNQQHVGFYWLMEFGLLPAMFKSLKLGNNTSALTLLVYWSAYVDIKLSDNSDTCCLAICWSIWCPCAGSCSYGSSPGPPLAVAWSCGRARGKTGKGPTPAVPSGRGPCTQTPGKRPLNAIRRLNKLNIWICYSRSKAVLGESHGGTFLYSQHRGKLLLGPNDCVAAYI